VWRNRGGRPGDRLVLTKPLGTGVISTAIKHQVALPASAAAAIEGMLRLNRDAAEATATVEVHAATDVTGFGLLGHLHYLARASGLAARVEAASVPFLPGAELLADAGEVPGGTRSNERFLASRVRWPAHLPAARQVLLCDAQTSGGLLLAVPEGATDALLSALESRRVAASVVGELTEGVAGSIVVA
jgi:selenide,water dikinase